MHAVQNTGDKLKTLVSEETYQDIEEFLIPHFDMNSQNKSTQPKTRRHWKIVQDGHGRWREIPGENCSYLHSNLNCGLEKLEIYSKRSGSPGNSKLLFSNNILNSVKSSSKSLSRSTSDSPLYSSLIVDPCEYKILSTATRANIFPGVGNCGWHSQTNDVHTVAALNLGKRKGNELRGEFYGIVRDEMAAWNEASVHHERMKKSWDVYLESLTKLDKVVPQMETPNKSQESGTKPKKTKKELKKSNKKRVEVTSSYGTRRLVEKEPEATQNNEQVFSKVSKGVNEDDDFWDFYEQPFVQS